MRFLRCAAGTLVLVGCSDRIVAPVAPPAVIEASSVAANPRNVLSAVVTAQVRLADSVAVHYGTVGETTVGITPAVSPEAGVVVVPVLGLHAGTSYSLQVIAFGAGRHATGEVMTFTTGALPHDLPRYTAGGPDPSAGYVVLASGAYGLVIDNAGRVVWYHRFPNGAGLNFQAQPTGRYVARPPTASGQPVTWIEIDPLGNVTGMLSCAGGLQPRFHDLLVLTDGSYWIMCDETRTLDLTAMGGLADARVTGTVVQHIDASGGLAFSWSPFDHLAVTDLDPVDRAGPVVNWTHGNALDLDADGNLYLSFRSLNEIVRIDTSTGAVVWRMGGPRNDFAFTGAPIPPFAGQHGVRITTSGEILLLDNHGDPAGSRARRYAYDDATRSAWLEASYPSVPAVRAELGGTTQHLPGGRTLVSFGSGGRVEEYDVAGNVVWRIEGEAGYVFRAQRIRSLYYPGIGLPR